MPRRNILRARRGPRAVHAGLKASTTSPIAAGLIRRSCEQPSIRPRFSHDYGPWPGYRSIRADSRGAVLTQDFSDRCAPATSIIAGFVFFQAVAVSFRRRDAYPDLRQCPFREPLRAASVRGESRNMAADQNNDDAPQYLLQLLKNAAAHHCSGDLEKAEQDYLRSPRPWLPQGRYPSAACEDRGKTAASLEKAIGHLDEMLELDPQHLDALIEKGALLHRSGRTDDAAGCFAIARSIAPEDVLVLSNLAVALADSGRRHEALIEFRRVLELQPDNIDVRHQMRRLTSAMVPFWHIQMLNDARRNDAFERAIRKAVEREGPGARILDIGTGSGLLSMMAARAGARNIVTCERVPCHCRSREAYRRVERL